MMEVAKDCGAVRKLERLEQVWRIREATALSYKAKQEARRKLAEVRAVLDYLGNGKKIEYRDSVTEMRCL